MFTIRPADPAFSALAFLALLASLPFFRPRHIFSGHAFIFVFSLLTAVILTERYVTLQRAIALRLTLSKAQFEKEMKFRPEVCSGAMQLYFSTSALCLCFIHTFDFIAPVRSNLRSEDFYDDTRIFKRGGLCALLLLQLYVWQYMVRDETPQIDCAIDRTEKTIQEDDIPLKVIINHLQLEEGSEWKKIAHASVHQHVWIQRVASEEGSEDLVFNMKTTLSPASKFYKPEDDGKPSGPVLRITMEASK